LNVAVALRVVLGHPQCAFAKTLSGHMRYGESAHGEGRGPAL
jgi:hypothetical protein